MALLHLTTELIVLAADNPFDGVAPDFSVFGAEFTAWWQKLLAGAWGIAFVASAFFLLKGLVGMNQAGQGGHPQALRESRSEAKNAALSMLAVAAVGIITGAILSIAS